MMELMSPALLKKSILILTFMLSLGIGAIPLGALLRRFYGGAPLLKLDQPKDLIKYALSLSLDLLKGVAVIALAKGQGMHLFSWIGGESNQLSGFSLGLSSVWLCGLLALIGHRYSPWKHLREGKGMATLVGIGLMLSPLSTLLGLIAFFIAYGFRISLTFCSIAGLTLGSVSYIVMYPLGSHLFVGLLYLYFLFGQFEPEMDQFLDHKAHGASH